MRQVVLGYLLIAFVTERTVVKTLTLLLPILLCATLNAQAGRISSGGDEAVQMVTLSCESTDYKKADGRSKYNVRVAQAPSFSQPGVLNVYDMELLSTSENPHLVDFETVDQSVSYIDGVFVLVLKSNSLKMNVDITSPTETRPDGSPLFNGVASLTANGKTIFTNANFKCLANSMGHLKD